MLASKSKVAAQATTWQNFKRLMSYAKPYKAGFVIAILGMLGYAGIDTLFFSQLQPLIDDGLTDANPNFMKWAPLFVIVCFIIRGICHFFGNYCLAWVGNNVVTDLRQNLFEHIMALPVTFHDKESTGTLISKLTFDTEQVLNATSKALLTLVQQGAMVIGFLAVMFYNSWQLSAIFLLITPIIAIIVTVVSKRFRQVSKKIQNAMGEVTSAAEQTFNAHKVVLTFGGQEREFERFGQINKHNRQQRMKMVATKSFSVPLIQIIASFALAFVLYVANLESMKASLTPGIFITVITCMTMLLRPLKLLTTVNSDFQNGMAACVSIFAVLDQENEKDTGQQSLEKAKGTLAFEQVDFSYTNDEKLALTQLSFTANAGETVALVGRSGSGKSTASAILLRFYDATAGKVLIDGKDITSYKLKDLRAQFAYVSQQVVLFNDSIANNIAYGKPSASRDEVLAAAKSAHVLEFAENMVDGIDTNIGDNGALLSGGQRQRVAIARALLCDAPFLILDEATSALDTESERHIQDALQVLQKDRTCIVIAHRLSTIENADKIIVMEQGKILEQGDHQTLLAKEGAYAKLHNFQFSE
ncbi:MULTISPECIES: lipid A export permease/ATP-binding protein MsbA [unclassified Colwellia]|uniref:lipid A export permease/ATP-binding protein MsbA n=1 Tax=unclassified Colwellia TaxID=196834 RepID=UPI0015F70BB3|nr:MULTISPECIES: lipid A export permease/ATP-binding protein MsbA [unclassified Colwellia]MBA6350018.1 lipid A export permease/ATP-binding protein MsbA [Colwellia sp. BRX8-9]MBA6355647.1 lipid A export permease/ATP-binding protein MsbA [Colwellia sp. BRX8-3]MBA6360583.1 lipid A export permease/ATP-binding protein MsbA [Colwellia sp. BRX8-6]MBA6367728.1 lipid A export permease/ATP-binding protein MsbA [Colwellia sp. BRX8-5]MBA6375967.1 lipid A export permease/ATP-binding protein MsbA [Colwellia